jgi:diguanylate cyclase (GGDEF)-like protein/PAS domain S-box-containing protein
MTNKVIDGGLLDEAAQLIVSSLMSGLGIKRAGIWVYDEGQRDTLSAHLVIDHLNELRETTAKITRDAYPAYFRALDEDDVISADHAPTNPLTSEFAFGYLDVLDIQSMLDAPIRLNGVTVGVVCCEQQTQSKTWNQEEQLFASLLADQFGRAMAAAEKNAQYEELRTTSKALDQQTKQLKALHSSLNHFSLISITDLDGVITEINDNFLSVSNYRRDEVIGQSHRLFQSKRQSKLFYSQMWNRLKSGGIWQGNICNRKKNGELFWLNSTISPVKNTQGQIEGYIGFSYEITREIDTQKQLDEAEKLAKVGSFRSNVTTEQWMCSPNLIRMLELAKNQELTWSYLERIIHNEDFTLFQQAYLALEEGDKLNAVVCADLEQPEWFRFNAQRQGEWVLGSCQNITLRVHQERELNDIIALQHTILDSGNFTIIATTPDGMITHFNKMAEQLLGYSAEEIISHATPAIFHKLDEVEVYASELTQELKQPIAVGFETFVAKAKMGGVDEREWTYIAKDGSTFPVSLSVTAILNDDNQIVGYLGIGKDITKLKQAESYSAQLKQIMMTASDIALFSGFQYDTKCGEFYLTNDNFRAIITEKYQQERIVFNHILDFFPEDEKNTLLETLNNSIRDATKFDIDAKLLESKYVTGSWLRIVGTPQVEDGVVTSIIGSIQDISSQKQLEEKLSSLALTDELTKLANRRALMAQLTQEWKRHSRHKSVASILIIDIDKFKIVNDKWGHDAGDFVLTQMSLAISNRIRESDVFGRFGGEEFLILAPNCDVNKALLLAETLRKSIESTTITYRPPLQHHNIDITITISIGVCELNANIGSLKEWLVAADKSLYLAKQNGRNQTVVYQKENKTVSLSDRDLKS